MVFLLSETDAFAKREPSKLFTSRFLKAMLAEVDLEDKVNKGLAKPGPNSTGRGRRRGVAKSRGRGRGRGRASFYRQMPGRGAYKYVNSLPNFDITDSFVGGRLLHFAGAWTEITKVLGSFSGVEWRLYRLFSGAFPVDKSKSLEM